MATTDKPRPAEDVPSDLMKVLKRSGIVPDRQFEELRARVLAGDYPFEARALADRLIREGVLTAYQADRLLRNKPHGMAVGKYVILERIGSGSMGRVYRAHHRLMGREVALKIVAPEIASNARIVARFQREMKLVGRLDHPNVVRAYDADRLEERLYIVMEYVAGASLGQLFRRRGPLPAADVARWAAQAARGLGHAHAQGIVHRDVKPSNLLLGDDGRVRVLDLGLATLMEIDVNASFATADNMAVGTVDYMSPEQAMGRDLDGRSDLYSLGCTMYHLIAGRHVFPGDSPIERLGKRINSAPMPLASLVPDLPPAIGRALDRLLANKPRDRYAKAEEAAEALETAVNPARPRNAASSSPPRVIEKIVEVEVEVEVSPHYPAWFRPLAGLAQRTPGVALAVVIAALAAAFGLGFLACRLAP